MEDPKKFAQTCLQEYLRIVNEYSYATKGPVVVPELLQYGLSYEMRNLNDEELISEYGSDPVEYYHIAFQYSLMTGYIAGKTWHVNFANFNDIMEDAYYNSQNYMYEIFEDLEMDFDKHFEIMDKLFDKMMELLEPYWGLNDPREYTFNALFAAYQLGISMILNKFGF